MGGKTSSIEQLKKDLEQVSKTSSILIVSEPNVTHQQITSLLDLLGKSGFSNISLATGKSEQHP